MLEVWFWIVECIEDSVSEVFDLLQCLEVWFWSVDCIEESASEVSDLLLQCWNCGSGVLTVSRNVVAVLEVWF